MLPTWTALVATLALQAGVTRYGAGAYTLARYDTTLTELAPAKTASLEVGPFFGLEHETPTSTLVLVYQPRLVMPADASTTEILNQASLNAAWRTDATLRWTANASACYGTNDFRIARQATCAAMPASGWRAGSGGTGPIGPAPPGVQPVPEIAQLKYLYAAAGLGLESMTSEHLTLSASASYLAQGGADAASRTAVPLQQGPTLWGSLDWSVTRDHLLATGLSASYYTFQAQAGSGGGLLPRTDTWTAQVQETWRHTLGHRCRFRLGLGVGTTGNALSPGDLSVRRTSPVADAGIELGFGDPALQIAAGARVAPFVDFTTGLAYERADAVATLGWPLERDWRLEASFSAGLALEGVQHGQATGMGRVVAMWTAAQAALITVGLSSYWQQAGPDFPASTFRDWTFFVGAAFRQVDRL